MKVLKRSYFQKGPPPLARRYSNLLSEIRELFAIWTPSRQILDFSSEKFSDLELDSGPDSKQYDMDIRTTTHLRLFTCWKSSQQRQKNPVMVICDVVVLISNNQTHARKVLHQAGTYSPYLYSFWEICNIAKRKRIRKTCIKFYLSLRRSI